MARTFLVAAALLAAGVTGSALAGPISYTVDCEHGQTIGSALERGDASKPLLLLIRGTCSEHVAIRRDDITLSGDPSVGGAVHGPGSVQATILIEAAKVKLSDLTITGGNNGVIVSGPFLAFMTNVVVDSPAAGDAVLLRAGGNVSLSNCTLMHAVTGLRLARGSAARVFNNSEIRDNTEYGIHASNNSTVAVGGDSKILANGVHGVELVNGSAGTINDSELSGNLTGILVSGSQATVGANNVISNNREHGVVAQAGAMVDVDHNTITHNQQVGVFGYLGATLVLHGNHIAGNGTGVACRADCTLQIGGARITENGEHGVVVMQGSSLILAGPPATDATGNLGWVDLWCGDTESSVDGLGEFFLGSTEGCTDFND